MQETFTLGSACSKTKTLLAFWSSSLSHTVPRDFVRTHKSCCQPCQQSQPPCCYTDFQGTGFSLLSLKLHVNSSHLWEKRIKGQAMCFKVPRAKLNGASIFCFHCQKEIRQLILRCSHSPLAVPNVVKLGPKKLVGCKVASMNATSKESKYLKK